MKKIFWILPIAILVILSCTKKDEPAAEAAPAKKTTLETVKERGAIKCGINTGLAGFASPDSNGNWTGLDIDICRAVSAAVFGDDTKIEYVSLSAQQRFTALQSGEVDMLARNTTWTQQRDTALGLNFAPVNYYDGQGFMVKKSSGIKTKADLAGTTICVQSGTTTELNLADFFRAENMEYTPVVIENKDESIASYFSGRCDSYTTDASGLAAERTKAENPADHEILSFLISKEPLAPAVRHGDDQWFDIVAWSVNAMINAEELGLTSENIDSFASTTNPGIQRILDNELGAQMGLDNKWAYNVVKLVGNYGESYQRNVGVGTPLNLGRGMNELWSKGGILYAPPLR